MAKGVMRMNPLDRIQPVVSLVFLGSFNPAIFHPEWFKRHGMLAESEEVHPLLDMGDGKVEVVTAAIAAFQTESIGLNVTTEKLVFQGMNPAVREELRDTATAVFRVLEHSPIRAFGINLIAHINVGSEPQLESTLAPFLPSDGWKGALGDRAAPYAVKGRMHDEGGLNQMNIDLERSNNLENGVYIRVNDHYQINPEGSAVAAESAIDAMRKVFSGSIERSTTFMRGVVGE